MSETTYWQFEFGTAYPAKSTDAAGACEQQGAKQVEVHPLGTGAELKRLREALREAIGVQAYARVVQGKECK